MNIGEEKETMNIPEKTNVVNYIKVKLKVNATVMAQIMNMDYINLAYIICREHSETLHMHDTGSMHYFLSAYVLCFMILRLYHTAVWHCCMWLMICMYPQSNIFH